MRIHENNKVTVSGCVNDKALFSHEVFGEKFYTVTLDVRRNSQSIDRVPLIVSEKLIAEELCGAYIEVNGQFRSYNDSAQGKLVLSVFVDEIAFLECEPKEDINSIELVGYVCKEPIYRETPLGRKITDLFLAVNRPYSKSDYIPCISWGRNASHAGSLRLGTKLTVSGRIQSRIYIKKLDGDVMEERTAYEVSVSRMEECANEK